MKLIAITNPCPVALDTFIYCGTGHCYPRAKSHITPRYFVSARNSTPRIGADEMQAIVDKRQQARRSIITKSPYPAHVRPNPNHKAGDRASCSQCGGSYVAPAGTWGFSHCEDHRKE